MSYVDLGKLCQSVGQDVSRAVRSPFDRGSGLLMRFSEFFYLEEIIAKAQGRSSRFCSFVIVGPMTRALATVFDADQGPLIIKGY